MYFSKYRKPFTLSFTRFTHFTLKIYAEFFYAFYPLLFYVLRFLPIAHFSHNMHKAAFPQHMQFYSKLFWGRNKVEYGLK